MVLSAKTRDLAYQGPYSRASTDHEQCSSNKSQHHLYGHHINQFEIETFNSFSPRSNLGESFKKKQHFIHGRPPCGSSHNFLTYGGIPATAPQVTSRHLDAVGSTGGTLETSMHHNATEKSTGFLYGKYDTAVGQPLPRKMKEKDRLPSWMMDKTSAELRKREIQSHEIEEDLARSRLEKANQRAHDLAEQKKDLNMLRNYRPWGKPGGGAPRGVENERASTIRTRQIEQLSADTSQVLPFGRPGAGAPNRTESGKIKAKLSSDKQIQLRAHQDGRPVDSIQLGNKGTEEYRTELDKLAEETRHRRHQEKEQDFQHDLQTLKYDPFGRPGGGAPLLGEHGSPRAGLPLHFSNHINELRNTEPRHPHAYSGSEVTNNSILPRQDFGKMEGYDKGKRQELEEEEELDEGFQFGMPGAGAPIRDAKGRVVAHGRHTLIKDKSGALVKSPTKSSEAYYPFGRPGGGAPIRDNKGKVRANVIGVIENEKLGKAGGKSQEGLEAKKGYLDTLKKMQEERESQKIREKSDLLEPVPAVSDWLERGLVGRPKYDPRTHEIRADPVVTSDVTRQRMNIPRNASEKSRLYHTELDEIIRQRDEHRKNDSVQQRQQSVEVISLLPYTSASQLLFFAKPSMGRKLLRTTYSL